MSPARRARTEGRAAAMDRFYLPPEAWDAAAPSLEGEEAHHCMRVLRKGVGDEIQLFDGAGRRGRAAIQAVEGAVVRLDLLEGTQSPPRTPRVNLCLAIPKGKTMDLVVQKAVELGVASIQPLVTEHTVVRLSGREAGRKQEKWQRVALEACKQCGQDVLPTVKPVRALEAWLPDRSSGTGVMGSLAAGARSLRSVLAGLPSHLTELDLLIGPEGDLSPRESGAAEEAGFQPVTLGEIVLRVETAVIFCLSVLNYELRLDSRAC